MGETKDRGAGGGAWSARQSPQVWCTQHANRNCFVHRGAYSNQHKSMMVLHIDQGLPCNQ